MAEKQNYSDAQLKVREATSDDRPRGPSNELMAEIAKLTHNEVAFTEIMQMIWERLKDHSDWPHVYKALVLLEYLIKSGSEKVATQCKENILAINKLNNFQFIEEGKDQGVNIREKAKQLVELLGDEERLKNERAQALKEAGDAAGASESAAPTVVANANANPVTVNPPNFPVPFDISRIDGQIIF